ncbi:MAG TPA: prolyl oligopeptidase family serine peptidase [Candidatus Nitrosopolaris sp.]|nr:prolyl oligopeptidase family serine peptidase [Candidatus Nitrosopolaris sp.]
MSHLTGILILNGDTDSETPVQQAFLLQQRLTDVNHPDHTLITYPNPGHSFDPSSQWFAESLASIEPDVIADLYSWLETHSGISQPLTTTPPTSQMSANTPSLITNTTSDSSSTSK